VRRSGTIDAMTTIDTPVLRPTADAVGLTRRLLRAGTSLAMRPAFEAEHAHLSSTWALPHDAPHDRRDRLLREAVVDRIAFAPESPGTRSLVARLLDGDSGLRFELAPGERALLEEWSDGGVEAFFEVARSEHGHVALWCLEDELTYEITGTVDPGLHELSPGTLTGGRVLPVGDTWVLAGDARAFPARFRHEVLRDALSQVLRHPERQYRNPRLRALATSLVVGHHQTFERLFGGAVVEGTLDELTVCIGRFTGAVGAGEVFVPVELFRDLDLLELCGADDLRAALVHHPVKGARLVASYGELRDLHESVPDDVAGASRLLDDPMVPSWVLAQLADRRRDRAVVLYGRVLGRGRLTEDDLHDHLAAREPSVDPQLPGIVILPSWAHEVETD
jgi:hypothetical protein